MYNVNNTSKELQEGNIEIAILPIGSTEQHSQHLPLGTDWIIAKEISQRVAEKLTSKVYLLPGMPFGTSPCHSGFKGTVWIRPTTLFYFIPIFEKTFYMFIFLIPMIISLAFSAYLLIKKFLKG